MEGQLEFGISIYGLYMKGRFLEIGQSETKIACGGHVR
jgi:hypothetical protein